MQVRCPSCRKVTAVPAELLEYLARCERCGAMLHIRASAVGAATAGGDDGANAAKAGRRHKRVVAKVLPRPVAVQSDRMSSGIFDLSLAERRAAARAGHAGGHWKGTPLDDASDSKIASMTAEHAPRYRPARPPAPRRYSARVVGFVALGLLVILAFLVVEMLYWHLRG